MLLQKTLHVNQTLEECKTHYQIKNRLFAWLDRRLHFMEALSLLSFEAFALISEKSPRPVSCVNVRRCCRCNWQPKLRPEREHSFGLITARRPGTLEGDQG
jgi:hypothetical protein